MPFFKPKQVIKPWGYELWWAENDHYIGKILHIEQDQQLSWQYHRIKDETLYLLRGQILIRFETEEGIVLEDYLDSNRSFHVPPGTKHRLIGGSGGGDVLEVSTSEVDDVVRLEDEYGREILEKKI